MRIGLTRGAGLGASALVALLIFLFAPVMPYSYPISIPKNYTDDAFSACVPFASNSSLYSACLQGHLVPPTEVNGRASAAFSLLRFGPGPYGEYTLAVQGNKSALVYWDGPKAAMAEALDVDPVYGGWPPVLVPPGLPQVSDARFIPGSNGLLTFSATVSGLPVGNYSAGGFVNYAPPPRLYFDFPGYGSNSTVDGVVWHTPLAYINCGGSGGNCVAEREVGAIPELNANETYPMRIVVVGYEVIGVQNLTQTYSNGQKYVFTVAKLEPYVYVHELGVVYPGSGVNTAWVQAFIGLVNAARGSTPLAEDPNLDAFALTRFETASANYQISDYGFDNQSATYFAGTGKTSTEEILFPSTYSPSDFVQVLQKEAPGHWTGLLNGAYAHFGYYVGEAPSVEFSVSCPVTEITQRNVNITQIAIQNGCGYKVGTVTWLLIVLSS